MTKELLCIVCPNGCHLTVEQDGLGYKVTGNLCARGVDFAVTEMTHPTRSLTTTVRTVFADVPVLPVRTLGDIPKELIPAAMALLNNTVVKQPVACGDTVVKDLLSTGVAVIATSDLLADK